MQSSCSSCPMGVALSLKPWLWDDSFKGLTPSRSAFLSFSLPFPFLSLSFFSLFYLFLSFITLPTRSVLDGNQHCRHYAGSASLASPCLQGRWNPQQNAHKTMVCTIQLGVPWPRFGLQPNWNIIKYNGICNQSLSPSLSLSIYIYTHIFINIVRYIITISPLGTKTAVAFGKDSALPPAPPSETSLVWTWHIHCCYISISEKGRPAS